MIISQHNVSVRQLYRMTAFTGAAGSILFLIWAGFRPALAFLLGALISLFNLWLFNWLARSLEPGPDAQENARKPWQASSFVSRYLIFFAAGYAIVNALGVSPLPVVLGLFASTAAVLLSAIWEILGSFGKSSGA